MAAKESAGATIEQSSVNQCPYKIPEVTKVIISIQRSCTQKSTSNFSNHRSFNVNLFPPTHRTLPRSNYALLSCTSIKRLSSHVYYSFPPLISQPSPMHNRSTEFHSNITEPPISSITSHPQTSHHTFWYRTIALAQ